MTNLNKILAISFYLVVTSCFSSSVHDSNYKGYYKIGQPYAVKDKIYYPRQYENYEAKGTASWYGNKFHGRKTANGEIFNKDELTAAHNTLPLPSVVRVTNLENGKSVVVRVNDRGPFSKNRVIDVSRNAATKLGFVNKGTTKVEVKLLKEETDDLYERLNLKVK